MENGEHQKDNENQCKVCKKKFTNFHNVQEHIKAVHEKIKRYFCDICNNKFYYKWQFRRHYKAKHDQELGSDLNKYNLESRKKKVFHVLPRPKRGKWIVLAKKI